MPAQIVTHLGTDFPWIADKSGHNQFTTTFTNGGSAYNISSLTFVVNIRKVGSDTNVLQLTQGSGITNGGATGILTIVLTAANISTYLPADYYYYEITYTLGGNGYKFLEGGLTLSAQGNPGTTTTSLSITTVNLAGTNVTAEVNLSGDVHFRGLFLSLVALQSGVPVGVPGDYADVDAGVGTDVQRYIWDDSDDEWVLGSGSTTITDGNGTTANGTAVDLGGVLTGPVEISGAEIFSFGDGIDNPAVKFYDAEFFVFPVLPAANPVSAQQAAHKAYVDLFTPLTRTINGQTLEANRVIPHTINSLRTGFYHTFLQSLYTPTSSAAAANSLRAYLVKVADAVTITEIMVEVTSGVGSTSMRVGIYQDSSYYPGALVSGSDAGTYDTTAITTRSSGAVSIALTPGLYWIATNANGAPSLRGSAGGFSHVMGMANTGFPSGPVFKYTVAFTYAAMPANFPGSATLSTAGGPTPFFKI